MSTIGNEINGTKIENLNKKFKEIQEKIINVNSYNDLKDLRSSLGPYYSLSIFADMAFSHTWEKLNLSPSDDELEKRIQVMVAEILHLYPGAVLADLAIKIGSDPYRHCFGIYGGDREKYQKCLTDYLKTYESGLYAPHLLLLKEKTHGILNYGNRDGEETRREEAVSRKDLCKLQISSFQEYENPDNLEEGSKEDSLEFPNFREEVTKPTFSTTDCKNSFKILYFHGGCNTSYSLLNEEGNEEDEDNDKDGAFAQLFLTLKKDENDKFYFPEDVALAILRSMNRLATVAALQKLQEQQRQLKRESQMLELLMEPLEQLTSGLAQTTESAQRLRAVLWDPDKSIFSAASRVWRYFEQGAEPIVAGVPCKVEHNTDRYLDPKILGLTVLAVFSEIFGKDPKDAKNVSELWAWVRRDLTGNDDATAQLRDTCQKNPLYPEGWTGCWRR